MKVYLSPLAEKKLALTLDYIESEFSIKSKKEFINKLMKATKQISQYPNSFPQSEYLPNLYKCVVTKQTVLFYRILENDIEIITITDARQNPERIMSEFRKLKYPK